MIESDNMDQDVSMTNATMVMASQNHSITSVHWFERDYGDTLIIYAMAMYHLYTIMVIGRIVHIIWYMIGLVGNTISLKIWTLPRMRKLNSSALYLVSISVCDMTYHACHVFFYLKYFWGLPSIDEPGLCQIWNVVNLIPQYASPLLVLGFTVERVISIVRPFQGERFSKHQRAPKEITVLFVFVILLALPQGIFWTVGDGGFCDIRHEMIYVYGIWSLVTETLIFLIVPAVTLILNIVLLKKASDSLKKQHNRHFNTNPLTRVHSNTKTSKPATKTLLCISFFRILTQLPVSVTYTLHNFDTFSFGRLMPLAEMANDPQKIVFLRYWGARMLVEIFGASHHALSVFIFYASTKQFRNELRNWLCNAKSVIRHGKSATSLHRSASSEMRLSAYLSVHRNSAHTTNAEKV